MNKSLLWKVYTAIQRGPAVATNMNEWHACRTTHCIAGWAEVLSGVDVTQRRGSLYLRLPTARLRKLFDAKDEYLSYAAADHETAGQRLLGITKEQSLVLFVPELWPEPFATAYTVAPGLESRRGIVLDRLAHFIETGV